MKVSGPIEAPQLYAMMQPVMMYPLMKVSGPIEAFSLQLFPQTLNLYPLMKVSGPIEANIRFRYSNPRISIH